MKQKIFFLIAVFTFLIIPGILAQYISGNIYIDELGITSFSVETDVNPNIPGLNFDQLDNELTGIPDTIIRLENGVWTFSLNLGDYETIFVDIHLPKNLKLIESVQGVDNIIDVEDKIITLIDDNKKLDFEVSYRVKEKTNYLPIIFLIILIFAVFLTYYLAKRKKENRLEHILPIINDNEKKIIEVLMKKSYRQKELRRKLEIPKASFARYMINLEKKKLIIREGEGRNKIVKLK